MATAKCPHCGIEFDRPARSPVPSAQTANLGCGTLILIAIIVAFFSGNCGGREKLDTIQRQVQRVEQAVDALAKEVRERKAETEKAAAP